MNLSHNYTFKPCKMDPKDLWNRHNELTRSEVAKVDFYCIGVCHLVKIPSAEEGWLYRDCWPWRRWVYGESALFSVYFKTCLSNASALTVTNWRTRPSRHSLSVRSAPSTYSMPPTSSLTRMIQEHLSPSSSLTHFPSPVPGNTGEASPASSAIYTTPTYVVTALVHRDFGLETVSKAPLTSPIGWHMKDSLC